MRLAPYHQAARSSLPSSRLAPSRLGATAATLPDTDACARPHLVVYECSVEAAPVHSGHHRSGHPRAGQPVQTPAQLHTHWRAAKIENTPHRRPPPRCAPRRVRVPSTSFTPSVTPHSSHSSPSCVCVVSEQTAGGARARNRAARRATLQRFMPCARRLQTTRERDSERHQQFPNCSVRKTAASRAASCGEWTSLR